jgi:hypothetical protein
LRALALFLIAGLPLLAEGPRIVYTKTFPGSSPAYIQISLERSGDSIYKEDPKDENPVAFKLNDADTKAIFDLADRLDHFGKRLESGLKVAFMGAKTFRYEGDGAPKEANFNYSEDLEAKTLVDWFERIAESERAYIDLERAVRFDKLGVNDSILRIEMSRNQKRLVAEEQFLPFLDRVVKSEAFMHMARTRAAALAESIRAPK